MAIFNHLVINHWLSIIGKKAIKFATISFIQVNWREPSEIAKKPPPHIQLLQLALISNDIFINPVIAGNNYHIF